MKFFKLLLIAFITLAVFNVIYNTTKIVPEIKEWGGLSETEKRQKLFGEYYDLLLLVNENTEYDAKILFLAKDEMSYYLARYYLYPRKLQRVNDNKNDYLISFIQESYNGYIPIVTSGAGYLYQKQ